MIIPITYLILGVTILTSIRAFSSPDSTYKMMLIPSRMSGGREWYRLFSHAFIHADYLHLFLNMFSLFLFGRNADAGGAGVEMSFTMLFGPLKGGLIFLLLYVGGIICSALPSIQKHRNNPAYMSLGASGAVSAVVFSYILMDPMAGLGFFFIPVFIPAWIFGVGYLVYSWYKSRRATDRIDHYAHFWGSIYGILFTLAVRPEFGTEFIEQLSGFLRNGIQ